MKLLRSFLLKCSVHLPNWNDWVDTADEQCCLLAEILKGLRPLCFEAGLHSESMILKDPDHSYYAEIVLGIYSYLSQELGFKIHLNLPVSLPFPTPSFLTDETVFSWVQQIKYFQVCKSDFCFQLFDCQSVEGWVVNQP